MAYIVREKLGKYILSTYKPIKDINNNKWIFSDHDNENSPSYCYIEPQIARILLKDIDIIFEDPPVPIYTHYEISSFEPL